MTKPHLDSLWRAFQDHFQYPTLMDLYTVDPKIRTTAGEFWELP